MYNSMRIENYWLHMAIAVYTAVGGCQKYAEKESVLNYQQHVGDIVSTVAL